VWVTGEFFNSYSSNAFSGIGDALAVGNLEAARFQIGFAATYVDWCASYLNFTVCD